MNLQEKAREFCNDYEEAKLDAFIDFFAKEALGYEIYNLDIDWYIGLLDSFTFEEEGEWCIRKALEIKEN